MIVLGIDPGTTRIGFGVIKKQNNAYNPIAYGLLENNSKTTDLERLNHIYDGIHNLIQKYQPQLFSIEKIFFFKNQKTVISVAQARGVILLAAHKNNVPIFECTPIQVKQGVTGYGRAEKNQVGNMIKVLLNLKEIPKPDDIADALAIAITGANFSKSVKVV